MATQARVTETEVFERFRASLIVFLDKARKGVDSAGDEVRRTRVWLTQDQVNFWEGEIRRRTKKLNQLEQELMNARMTGNSESAIMMRQQAVNKMKRDIIEAETKLRRIKKWSMSYDSTVDPIVKRLENLRHLLDQDMPKAIAFLANAQKTLDSYAEMAAPVTESAPATPATTTSTPTEVAS